MNDFDSEELLSALLDGELTEAQRAEVERLLAERPDYRHLLDELRALSTSVRQLPRYKLDDDFSQQVLRRAERRMLAGDDHTPALSQPSAGPIVAPAPSEDSQRAAPQRWSWHRLRRPLVWSGLAAAAALALVVFSPDRWQGADRLAMHDAETTATSPAPTAEAAPATARFRRDAAAADQPAAGHAPATPRPDVELTLGAPLLKAAPAEAASPIDDAARKAGAERPNGLVRGGFDATLREEDMGREHSRMLSISLGAELVLDDELVEHLAAVPTSGGVAIVSVDVPRSEAQKLPFSRLLTSNNIDVTSQPLVAGYGEPAAAEADKSQQNRRPQDGQAASADPYRIVLWSAPRDLAEAAPAADAPAIENYFVVATNEQLEATLADLNGSLAYTSVIVQPSPDVPLQQQWLRYNRAAAPTDRLQAAGEQLGLQPGDDRGSTVAKFGKAETPGQDEQTKDQSLARQPAPAPSEPQSAARPQPAGQNATQAARGRAVDEGTTAVQQRLEQQVQASGGDRATIELLKRRALAQGNGVARQVIPQPGVDFLPRLQESRLLTVDQSGLLTAPAESAADRAARQSAPAGLSAPGVLTSDLDISAQQAAQTGSAEPPPTAGQAGSPAGPQVEKRAIAPQAAGQSQSPPERERLAEAAATLAAEPEGSGQGRGAEAQPAQYQPVWFFIRLVDPPSAASASPAAADAQPDR